MSTLTLSDQAAPSTPSAGKRVLYGKADGRMYNKNAAGIETPLIVTASQLAFRNKIICGNFNVNQRVVAGTVILAAGQYGHDRWKAGAAGCTYTFSTSNGITTLNITAGSLVQVVYGPNLSSGNYILTWAGTAQGKIAAGAYGASGVTAAVIGGTNTSVEFNIGTLSLVQFENDNISSPFEHRFDSQEMDLALWYHERTELAFAGVRILQAFLTQYLQGINFLTPKRITPTVTIYSRNGTANMVSSATSGADVGTSSIANGVNTTKITSIFDSTSPFTIGNFYEAAYVADCEL